jgi:hypothetical protein
MPADDPTSADLEVENQNKTGPGESQNESRLAKQKAYREANREKHRAWANAYRLAHMQETRERKARWREANLAKERKRASDYYLRNRYGLTPEEFSAMRRDQNDRCAICRTPLSLLSRIHIDHCHNSGKIRGLLCNNCNTGMGMLGDDVKILRRAIRYLQRHPDELPSLVAPRYGQLKGP